MMTDTMSYMTDYNVDLYNENNYIRVYWEDTLDNYNKSNEKLIEKYFQDKYNTNKVKVVFKPIANKTSEIDVDLEAHADASDVILDDNYQDQLIDKYLKDNNIEVNRDFLKKLDDTINSELTDYKEQNGKYKNFKIKEIEFSNFLSYGENNIIKIDKPGITSIISNPANFSGKSTLTVDLLSFLFFGVTSKTDKLDGIFNKFTNKDLVVVKGTVEIEGDEYIIKRTISRKESKGKGMVCKSEVDFYQILPKGGTKQLNGEQRKYTDDLIKNYVGTYDDFLLTILATGDNLDDLIKTKPTERGRLLTRFIGLEFYREKEKIGKKHYAEWKEKSHLAITNVAEVQTKIDKEKDRIVQNNKLNDSNKQSLITINANIQELEKTKDNLLSMRVNNVDTEQYKINESTIIEGIDKLNKLIADKNDALTKLEIAVPQPSENFDVDTYQSLSMQAKEIDTILLKNEFQISSKKETIKMLKDSELCVTCSRPLEGVDNSDKIDSINNEINALENDNNNKRVELNDLNAKITLFEDIKKQWDDFNKNELLVSKAKGELATYNESLSRGTQKLNDYRANVKNIENNKKIDTELTNLRIKITNANNERDLCMLQIKSLEKDVESSEKLINDYNLLIKELKKDELIDKIYKVYLELFGKNGISKMILSTMIPLINSYLQMLLVDTAEFVLELRMDEKGDVEFWMVDAITDIEKPLYAGSGYERTVSSLALRCVLRKVCSLPKPNIIIFDEVTGKVANENLERLGSFFDKIKLYFEHIWLISHNPLVQEWADNTIKVAKKDNISKIIHEDN